MSMTTLDIERDRRKVERAMRKKARQMGAIDPTREEIPEYDRNLFGRPVRIEVDVCVPLDELRKLLNSIRADVTDALIALEKQGTPSDRRYAAHRRLCDARGKAYALSLRLKAEGRSISQ
jgi:hypothetical protein